MKTRRNFSASQLGLGLVAGSFFASSLYVSGCSSEPRRCELTNTCAGAGRGNAGEAGDTAELGGGGSIGISGAPNLGGANAGGEAGAEEGGQLGEAGAGMMSDPCTGVVCDAPPGNACVSASKFKAYDATGSCSAGECSYASHDIACTCTGSACTTDPCIGVTCTAPPASKCLDADTLTKYASSGTCSVGSCSYGSIDVPCSFGCANGACKADPCLGVSCTTQKAPICKNATTVETYSATGTCSKGTCNYTATDNACPTNKACGGAGVCNVCKSDASCGDTCAACPAATPKCKDLGTTSKCVACSVDADCGLGVCDPTTNSCQANPVGCNTFALGGSIVAGTGGTPGTLPTGTRGTIVPGTYVLTAWKSYGAGGDPQSATLIIGVSGNTVTINEYDHLTADPNLSYNGPVRSTGTFSTSGSSLALVLSCASPAVLVTGQPFPIDYSVVSATTLQLIYPASNGMGWVYTYTKQ